MYIFITFAVAMRNIWPMRLVRYAIIIKLFKR